MFGSFPRLNPRSGVLLVVAFVLGCSGSGPRPPGTEPPPAVPVATAFPSSANPDEVLVLPDHSRAAVPVSSVDAQQGQPDALVTIVEFTDFQCPFCARVQPTLAEIRALYPPDQVRFVFKHNPLPFHEQARPAHEAAATVFGLGGATAFWNFYRRAFDHQQALGSEAFERWAVEAGIEREAFRQAYASKRYAGKVDDDVALAKRIDVLGTPNFLINGVKVMGAQPLEAFRKVIDEQLTQARALVAGGTRPADVYPLLTNRNAAAPAPKPSPDSPSAEEDTAVWKVPVLADDPVRGPADALVTIVQWSDYQCPFCKRVEETLQEILRIYGRDVRLVWKDNPLPFHQRALPAAILARLAYQQKGNQSFWGAHDALFASAPDLDDAALARIAARFSLSWPAVQAAIARSPARTRIESGADLAMDMEARGTPHFFINGVRLQGAQPIEKFKDRIDAELERARALVARGVPRAQLYPTIIRGGRTPPPPERKVVRAPSAQSAARGAANARVVIQEWADFQCPFSKRAEETMAALEREFGGSVRIVWRHLPLPFHQHAALAAEAAEEALAQQGAVAFWKYHDRLFEAQSEPGGLERLHLEELAAELGLDLTRFRAALDSGRHRAKVKADLDAAQDAGITGTPAFVVNGYFVNGAQPVGKFRKLVQRALKEGKKP